MFGNGASKCRDANRSCSVFARPGRGFGSHRHRHWSRSAEPDRWSASGYFQMRDRSACARRGHVPTTGWMRVQRHERCRPRRQEVLPRLPCEAATKSDRCNASRVRVVFLEVEVALHRQADTAIRDTSPRSFMEEVGQPAPGRWAGRPGRVPRPACSGGPACPVPRPGRVNSCRCARFSADERVVDRGGQRLEGV